MPSLVVVGAQWGDEGKGKLVDYLSSGADLAVRFQGGNNAGHTLVVGGVKTKLQLVPSGILRPHSFCAIGAGCVLNPGVLLEEMRGLEKAGIDVNPKRLVIDRDAHLILPYHVALDQARESSRGDSKIGTTGRGIGPAYEDRATRCGVRVVELTRLSELKSRLEPLVEQKNKYLEHVLGSELQVSFEEVSSALEEAAEELCPFIGNVSKLVHSSLLKEKKVIFEGAQGALLDQMHGTIPFVTSSPTISGAASTGVGIGPSGIHYVLGVAKAYATRVGSGPFPTQIEGEIADKIREIGGEFGTITGRPRRCGWFDAVAMQRAVRLNGMDSVAITKLDVLSGLEKVKVCINYRLNGEKLEDVPSLESEFKEIEPEYIELDGWKEDLTTAKKWHHLPQNCRFYLSTLSEIIGCPVSIASVAPERESTIFSKGASFIKNFVRVSKN